MNVVAVIPARGGSKGIFRKNLAAIGGRPLVARAIEQALRSETVTRVIVSTDDPEIAAVSQACGAEVVIRPALISGDLATSESALIHVLDTLDEREGQKPDVLVFIQCTSPLTISADVDGTVRALLDEDADSALAVTPFDYYVWRRADGNSAVGINHDPMVRKRRQDLEPQYLETGAVYAMRVPGFEQARHRFFGKTALYVMPRARCLEVDEPVDLDLAETLARSNQRDERARLLPQPIHAVVFDFDGVFTDNRVLVDQDGKEAVWCDRGDGMGLAALKQAGLPLLVISKERNPVVRARCDKLRLQCLNGVDDKVPALRDWLNTQNIDPAHVVFLGNDINDIDCLTMVGCGVVVGDAHPQAKRAARIVLVKPGGAGAVRELTDLIEDSFKK